MRTHDVEVGATYLVEVPWRLPASRYPAPGSTAEGFADWWRLSSLRGSRFPLTIVDVNTTEDRPTAQGLRTLTHAIVRLTLTTEQTLSLGLPPGTYEIIGQVTTHDGHPVKLPEVETLTVPVRWLRPLASDLRPTHRDITGEAY